MNTVEKTIIETIEAQREQIVAVCQKLLQTPSVNGVHDERFVAEVITEVGRSLGLMSKIVGDNLQRPNVLLGTSDNGETGLLLIGHLDTVTEGDVSQWTHPPFGGEIVDGRVYGRGAVDTKGGMTAALFAMSAVMPHLKNGHVAFVGVPDEESGATGTLGIKYLAREGLLHGTGAIYCYSGKEINMGHRGLLRYRVACHGESTHTGSPQWQSREKGANAILGMAAFLLEVEKLEFPYSDVPYFDRYRTLVTPGTTIEGGVAMGIVPNFCEATLDVRTTLEMSGEIMDGHLQTAMDVVAVGNPKLRFEFEKLNDLPPAMSPLDSFIFEVVEQVTEEFTGEKPPRVIAGPANEGYLLVEHGIPTICGFGPYGENFHGIDEFVTVEGLVEATILYALTALRMDVALGESNT